MHARECIPAHYFKPKNSTFVSAPEYSNPEPAAGSGANAVPGPGDVAETHTLSHLVSEGRTCQIRRALGGPR
jgi:hypothetical protein